MKHSTLTPSRLAALLCAGAMGFAVQAHALEINATNLVGWTIGTNYWTVSENTALFADDVEMETTYGGQLASAYKMDFDDGVESGPGKEYYSTAFSGLGEDGPTGATITWGGSGLWIDCPDCFLVVKDGSADPSAYIFNLGNWDGKEMITLSGFWEGTQGAISYVEIFGYGEGGATLVPEADTYAMLLAGLGLVGFAARRRLRNLA